MQDSPRVFVILGMHKSGTTLVSRLLIESGIDMGVFELDGDYDSGDYLERAETRAINRDLLACGNRTSLLVPRPMDSARIRSELMLRGKDLVADLNRRHKAWGFKDPRTCLTYRYWEKVLPDHRIIAVYRNPREVVRHYFRRRSSGPASIFRAALSLHAWCVYNQYILDILARVPEALILNYGTLMKEESELARLQEFLGVPVKDMRDPARHRSTEIGRTSLSILAACIRLFSGRDAKGIERRLDRLSARDDVPA